jgi:cupin fold WbuC family metalloprotein
VPSTESYLEKYAIKKSSDVYHAKNWGISWGVDLIDELKTIALKSTRSRSRLCLHPYISDNHQEMLIVMHKKAIERPQKRTIGFDTKIVIEGEANLHYLNDEGDLLRIIELGRTKSHYVHTCTSEYHALEIVSDWFVFLEILKGPFTEKTTKFADFPLHLLKENL